LQADACEARVATVARAFSFACVRRGRVNLSRHCHIAAKSVAHAPPSVRNGPDLKN